MFSLHTQARCVVQLMLQTVYITVIQHTTQLENTYSCLALLRISSFFSHAIKRCDPLKVLVIKHTYVRTYIVAYTQLTEHDVNVCQLLVCG